MVAPAAGPAPAFAELLAALPVAVLLIDPAGRIAYANAEAETLLNRSERLMLGGPLGALLMPPVVPAADDDRTVAAYDAPVRTVHAGQLRLDWVEARLVDHPGWRTLTLHQVGARRIGQAADRAAAARAAVGAAAMLAHEIKNPLSGIRGAAQLIGDGTREGAAALTGLIVTEVDRIAGLIDRMEDFTDTRPPRLAPENIYPLLDHARDVALAGFARGVTIEERFDPSLPSALIDRDALLQILLNLLKNAAEAVVDTRDPRIVIATAYRHGMAASAAPGRPRLALPIEVVVADTGPGAPDDIAEHVFDPFVSGKPEGRGLGLALVDKLVRAMGGIVQYAREGTPPMTVFRLLLPRASA